MPRIPRGVAIGFPHHVVQRGNNREQVFFKSKDKEKYLLLLKKYSDKWKTPILAYCLMSNHVHLLAKPLKEESLYKMMQGEIRDTPIFTGHKDCRVKLIIEMKAKAEGWGIRDVSPLIPHSL